MPTLAFKNAASTLANTGGHHDERDTTNFANGTQCQVLIADDDPGVRRALTRGMERAGYQALVAADVPEAIALASDNSPSLAVVDLHMPSGSGLDLVRSLKGKAEKLHVTVLSGDPAMQARVDCFDAGADDYVAKPVYMPELISRLRAAEREQQARRALAQEKLRAKQLYVYAKEMASFLAHDLNNGFCIALGNVEFLRFHQDVDEECKKALKATRWVLNRMSALTDNFLDIERLEEGALTPRRALTPLHELMSEVLKLNHTREADDVTATVDCDLDLEVYVDGPLVERTLHNIVGNAMRYVHPGGEIRCAAHTYAADDGTERLIISVANTGPVISKAGCQSIFEKIGPPQDAKSRHGLGLYFCRLACEAHGGTIGVTSAKGRTTFTLDLSCV
jgi:two-component system sensor histidine kinase/response regulator